jgi:hypothetical protein
VAANRTNSIDGLNRVTAVSGNPYAYDANGNLITGDPVWLFSYDAENKLKLASASTGSSVSMAIPTPRRPTS